MLVFLNQFEIVKPKICLSQEVLLNWLIKCHQLAEKNTECSLINPDLIMKIFQRYSVKSNHISQRYFECDDILSDDFADNVIYKINSTHKCGVDIATRANYFFEKTYDVFKIFYNTEKNLPRPNHLIHVTCTGYISPSAAQKIISDDMGWNTYMDVTHAYHMGCYASLPAVRLARSLVLTETTKNNNYSTDIVHNELCGLHMNAQVHTPEQAVIQTLFADGHIKYTVSLKKREVGKNFKILAILEKIIPNSTQDMSWLPGPWGMMMNLSREVPNKIKLVLKQFTNDLIKKAELKTEEGLGSLFAIHPGGPQIIDSVQDILELKNEQIKESRKILLERGNMSSATLPHIWNEILQNHYPMGTNIISFAFGPGLTLFGAVYEVC